MAEVARLTGVRRTRASACWRRWRPRPAAALEGAALPTLDDHLADDRCAGPRPRPRRRRGRGRSPRRADGRRRHARRPRGAAPTTAASSSWREVRWAPSTTRCSPEKPCGTEESGSSASSSGRGRATPPSSRRRTATTSRGLPEGLLGAIPAGAPRLAPAAFCAAAPGWLPGLDRRPARLSGATRPDAAGRRRCRR